MLDCKVCLSVDNDGVQNAKLSTNTINSVISLYHVAHMWRRKENAVATMWGETKAKKSLLQWKKFVLLLVWFCCDEKLLGLWLLAVFVVPSSVVECSCIPIHTLCCCVIYRKGIELLHANIAGHNFLAVVELQFIHSVAVSYQENINTNIFRSFMRTNSTLFPGAAGSWK